MAFVRAFDQVGLGDVALVGGKNASLGELVKNLAALGVAVPNGFCVTAEGYRHFLETSRLAGPIRDIVARLRKDDVSALVEGSDRIRDLVLGASLPRDLVIEIEQAYRGLSRESGVEAADVAVRSSATAEDLPTASFAGQQESFLNVRGTASVCDAVKKAFASLFTPRAVSYRLDMGFDSTKVALSVGIQKMVRSDLASAGVIFTLDPDTGHRERITIRRGTTRGRRWTSSGPRTERPESSTSSKHAPRRCMVTRPRRSCASTRFARARRRSPPASPSATGSASARRASSKTRIGWQTSIRGRCSSRPSRTRTGSPS